MNNFLGSWRLAESAEKSGSSDCIITFLTDSRVVFEENFVSLGWGRFWFTYELDSANELMFLTPINQSLKNIYNGRKRTVRFHIERDYFRIMHSNGSFSEYRRMEHNESPHLGDKFPISKSVQTRIIGT
jgi:hypothetical protein